MCSSLAFLSMFPSHLFYSCGMHTLFPRALCEPCDDFLPPTKKGGESSFAHSPSSCKVLIRSRTLYGDVCFVVMLWIIVSFSFPFLLHVLEEGEEKVSGESACHKCYLLCPKKVYVWRSTSAATLHYYWVCRVNLSMQSHVSMCDRKSRESRQFTLVILPISPDHESPHSQQSSPPPTSTTTSHPPATSSNNHFTANSRNNGTRNWISFSPLPKAFGPITNDSSSSSSHRLLHRWQFFSLLRCTLWVSKTILISSLIFLPFEFIPNWDWIQKRQMKRPNNNWFRKISPFSHLSLCHCSPMPCKRSSSSGSTAATYAHTYLCCIFVT